MRVLFASFLLALLLAAAPARGEDALATVMELSGMDTSLSRFARSVEIIAKDPQVDPDIVPAWRKAAGQAFAADRMHADLAAALAAQFDREAIETGIAFQRSELGRALAAARVETDLLIEEDPEAFDAAGRAILAGMDFPQAALFREILELHGFTRMSEATDWLWRRLYREAFLLVAEPGTEAMALEALEMFFPIFSQWLREDIELMAAHTLAQLDRAQLDALAEESRPPDAQRTEHRINKAYFLTYEQGIDRFLVHLGHALASR